MRGSAFLAYEFSPVVIVEFPWHVAGLRQVSALTVVPPFPRRALLIGHPPVFRHVGLAADALEQRRERSPQRRHRDHRRAVYCSGTLDENGKLPHFVNHLLRGNPHLLLLKQTHKGVCVHREDLFAHGEARDADYFARLLESVEALWQMGIQTNQACR